MAEEEGSAWLAVLRAGAGKRRDVRGTARELSFAKACARVGHQYMVLGECRPGGRYMGGRCAGAQGAAPATPSAGRTQQGGGKAAAAAFVVLRSARLQTLFRGAGCCSTAHGTRALCECERGRRLAAAPRQAAALGAAAVRAARPGSAAAPRPWAAALAARRCSVRRGRPPPVGSPAGRTAGASRRARARRLCTPPR